MRYKTSLYHTEFSGCDPDSKEKEKNIKRTVSAEAVLFHAICPIAKSQSSGSVCRFLFAPALSAVSIYLELVAHRLKVPFRHKRRNFGSHRAPGNFGGFAASQADQVVVVNVPRQFKSGFAIRQQGSSHKALLGLFMQIPVNRAQTDIRIFFANASIDFLRGRHFSAGPQHIQDRLLLQCTPGASRRFFIVAHP